MLWQHGNDANMSISCRTWNTRHNWVTFQNRKSNRDWLMIISTGVSNWYSMWSGNYTPCLIGSSCEQNVKSLISFQYINLYIVYFADIICKIYNNNNYKLQGVLFFIKCSNFSRYISKLCRRRSVIPLNNLAQIKLFVDEDKK